MRESDRRHRLQYSMVGKGFVLPVLVLMGGGYLLDRYLGGVVGFFLGLYFLVHVERKIVADETEREKSREKAGSPNAAKEEDA
ncbi:MAG: AtpZ/AtpI family protein [Phycisphaerae bacterium]